MRACFNCGELAGTGKRELRPYGPHGQDICFECMMSSPTLQEAARVRFANRLAECGDVAVLDGGAPRPAIEAEERRASKEPGR